MTGIRGILQNTKTFYLTKKLLGRGERTVLNLSSIFSLLRSLGEIYIF